MAARIRPEDEKLVLHLEALPEKAKSLTPEQVAYLDRLRENLDAIEEWEGETLQSTIFSTAKAAGIKPGNAFKAVYLSFLNKERGPRAGSLLSYLEKSFAIARLQEAIAANPASPANPG